MKKQFNILLAQPWELTLAHEVANGFFDYARTKRTWKVLCLDWHRVWRGLESGGWTSHDGLVIAGNVHKIEGAIDPRWKVVATHWTPKDCDIYQSDINPISTGRFAADYLLGSGYKRLAGISFAPFYAHTARAESFVERCRAQGVESELFVHQGRWNDIPENLIVKAVEWARQRDLPTAFFCTNDRIGIRMIKELRQSGLHVPDDVAVLGCEDDQLICDSAFPELSSVNPPYRKVGFEAARLLDKQLMGKSVKTKQVWLEPDSVTVRMSTSLFATPDTQLRRAIEFIRSNACENIQVTAVAKHCGLTVPTLQRRFRNKVGRGPQAEIQLIRIKKVKELLRVGSFTLDEIAEATGYPSGSYLSKVFKRKVGMTVRQYRSHHLSHS